MYKKLIFALVIVCYVHPALAVPRCWVSYSCGAGTSTGTLPDMEPVSSPYTIIDSSYCAPPSGQAFSGWVEYSSDPTGNVVQPWDSGFCNEPVMEYTAQYEPAGATYTVTYSCNGGTGTAPSNETATENQSFTPASNTCTAPSGYSGFAGWLVSGTNDVKQAGTAFTWNYNENKTLTAQWTGNTVNLTWYGDGGTTTLSGGASSCTYGGTITPLPTAPTKLGYHLARWKVKQCKIPSDLVNSNSGYTDMYELGKLIYSGIGKVQFDRKCSNTNGTYATLGTPSDTNGRYCWCAATAWIPDGGNQCNISNPVWVFNYADEDFDECETYCNVNACASEARINSNFRSAVFDASD